MSEGRPRLVAVDGEARAETRPSRASGRRGPRELGRWLLVGACVVLALALVHEVNRARRLEGDLSRSRSELSAARADLAASRVRIHEARTRATALAGDASALADRIRELESLLAPPPGSSSASGSSAAPSPPAPPGPPPAP